MVGIAYTHLRMLVLFKCYAHTNLDLFVSSSDMNMNEKKLIPSELNAPSLHCFMEQTEQASVFLVPCVRYSSSKKIM